VSPPPPPAVTDTRSDPAPENPKRRWEKPAAIAVGVFLLILAPFWAPLFLRRLAFFRVRHVEVVGARYIQPRDVVERLNVDTLTSVWDPAGRLEARVRGHPLIREVRVGRRLPGTLVVRVVEHVPVALVATTDGFRAYDERGVSLPIDPTAADVDAPILARPDSALLRLLASARLQAPGLYRRLSEIRRERAGPGGNELLIVFDSIPVRALGDITLQRLAEVELVEQDLARRRLRATELDLRYRDQVIARLP
jgi:cell division protein FtsQ